MTVDVINRVVRESTDKVYSSILQKAADIVKTILRISRVKTDPVSPVTTPVAAHEVMLKRLVDWLISRHTLPLSLHTLLIITLFKLLTIPLEDITKRLYGFVYCEHFRLLFRFLMNYQKIVELVDNCWINT